MSQALLLLATFLAVVVVGGTLVALNDAVERLWHARRTPLPTRAPVRSRVRAADPPPARRPGPPLVAWRHLH